MRPARADRRHRATAGSRTACRGRTPTRTWPWPRPWSAGYLGVTEALEPSPQAAGNAYAHARTLPRTLEEALERFRACAPVRALLGEAFYVAFAAIKDAELEAFQGVISSWERDHLLLKV